MHDEENAEEACKRNMAFVELTRRRAEVLEAWSRTRSANFKKRSRESKPKASIQAIHLENVEKACQKHKENADKARKDDLSRVPMDMAPEEFKKRRATVQEEWSRTKRNLNK